MFLVTCTSTDDLHDDVSSLDVLKSFDCLHEANAYAHYGYIIDEFGSCRHFEDVRRSVSHLRARTFCTDAHGGTLDIRVVELTK